MKNKKYWYLLVILILIFVITFFVLIKNVEEPKYKKENNSKEEITDRIPVLTFHRIVPDDIKQKVYKNNQWVGSADVFDNMLKYLYDNGYKTISTEELYNWYKGDIEYDKKTVLITFDDGFYEDYYVVLPILKKYNFKATSFVVGSRISDITHEYDEYKTYFLGMDVINKVREEYPNFEFQSHSYNLHYYTGDGKHKIKSLNYDEIVEDINNNSKFKFTTMAYPYGDYNEYIEKALEEKGYLVAFSFGNQDYAKRDSDRFAIPRIKINGYTDIDTLKKWLDY